MDEITYYKQQASEPSRVGFRNSDDEPWIWYDAPNGGVLSFKVGLGHYPREGWERIG